MTRVIEITPGDGIELHLTAGGGVTLRIEVVPDHPVKPAEWAYPVTDPESWACRGFSHRLGSHTGYDLNLNIPPYGNIDAGQPIYAVTTGVVHYVTPRWGTGGGMAVVHHATPEESFYARYAHLTVVVNVGDVVHAGTLLGHLVSLPNGAHLHFDMALQAIAREWLNPGALWLDPAVVLAEHLDHVIVATLCGTP